MQRQSFNFIGLCQWLSKKAKGKTVVYFNKMESMFGSPLYAKSGRYYWIKNSRNYSCLKHFNIGITDFNFRTGFLEFDIR